MKTYNLNNFFFFFFNFLKFFYISRILKIFLPSIFAIKKGLFRRIDQNKTTLFPNSESCHSPALGIQELEKNEEEQVIVGDQE